MNQAVSELAMCAVDAAADDTDEAVADDAGAEADTENTPTPSVRILFVKLYLITLHRV